MLRVDWTPAEQPPTKRGRVWLKVKDRIDNRVYSRDDYYHPKGIDLNDCAEWRNAEGENLETECYLTVLAWAPFERPEVTE